MSNDIRDIIRRLDMVEGRLNPAQQKVPQLPALFKPHHIRALGSKTDPAHPMDGYMVGDSVQPRRTALEEAMAEIEEDMLSKVKRDLTHYLDRLEKKVSINRNLKDKAKDAVKKRQPEEIEEFAPVGGDDREPDDEEILRQLAAQWWNGTEQQMAKAQRTLAAMGWEIGPDESGDDDAGVYVYRIGDDDGRDTIPFAHSDLDILDEVDFSGKSGMPSEYQSVKDYVGQQHNAYKNASSMTDAGVNSGAISRQDAEDAKRQLAGNMTRGAFDATLAGIRGDSPDQAYMGSMVGSMGDMVAQSGLTPELTQQVAAEVEKYRGPNAQDLTKHPEFAKLSKEKQAQVVAVQNQMRNYSDADMANIKNFDATKAGAQLRATGQDIANSQKTVKANSATADLASPATYAALGIARPNPASIIAGQNKLPAPAPAPAPTTPAPTTPAPTTPAPPTTPTPAPKATTTTPAPAAPTTPAATFEMADGKSMDCYGDDNQGYELRHGGKALPSRFRNLDDAGMAVRLYRARRQAQQRNSNTDYIEER